LRGKLTGSENEAVDEKMAKILRELTGKKRFTDEMNAFRDPTVESVGAEWFPPPEDFAYPFILEEAERLGVDTPVSSAEMKLRIARHYERADNPYLAYAAYLDCMDFPWPYEDTEPIEGLERMMEGLGDCQADWIDKITLDKFDELLSIDAFGREMESLARLDQQAPGLPYPENVVYPFILDEAIRLRLLPDDVEEESNQEESEPAPTLPGWN
jgi:hypothetical protein